jgi:general secretion pathway protein A
MDALEEFLVQQYKDGKTFLVLIDEAQLLRLESMECIRSLLNYETNTESFVKSCSRASSSSAIA